MKYKKCKEKKKYKNKNISMFLMFQIFHNFDKTVSTKTIKDILAKNLKEHHLITLPTQEKIFSRERWNQFPVKEHQSQEAHFDS